MVLLGGLPYYGFHWGNRSYWSDRITAKTVRHNPSIAAAIHKTDVNTSKKY